MIDIIIPAYNAHNTIIKTLINLKLQTIIDKSKIYIVNDCSIKDYSNEIKLFKDELDIVEIKTPHNMGPGAARQYALNQTKGKYIVFLDADDQLYNCYTLFLLYNEIETKKLDLVMGDEIVEDKGLNVDNSGSLHGKIYRRSFIEKNKIRFNNTRYSEDDSFNKLIINLSNKVKKVNFLTYLYLNNPTSITSNNDKKVKILMMYIYNMIWTCLELKKRNVKEEKIAKLILHAYIYVYKQFKESYDTNYFIIYTKCYRLEELYAMYEKNISDLSLANKIRSMIYCGTLNTKEIIKSFNEFRNRFGKNNSNIDIIIPAYNAHSTILDALNSIAIQTISNKISVYIVDDCSDKNYDEEISKMNDFINIKQIRTPKRLGPCGARQYGIDHSSNEYIVFLDADDEFNNGLSLKDLYSFMEENKCNVGSSNYIEENNNGLLFKKDGNLFELHGKIFRRDFLISNNLRFNKTKSYCKFGFNQLINLVTSVYIIDNLTYIKKYNNNSLITEEHNTKDLITNTVWVIKEAEKRKCNLYLLYNYAYNEMFGLYYRYLTYENIDQKNDILIYSKELKKIFIKYKSKISVGESNAASKKMINRIIDTINENKILDIDISFNEFLSRIE